jgi:hypothetical protein
MPIWIVVAWGGADPSQEVKVEAIDSFDVAQGRERA